MIIVKIPFRLPLGGGGTDLPAYYEKFGGYVLTSTINKYMYVFVSEPSTSDKIKLYHHSKETVNVNEIDKIEHAIIRESLKLYEINRPIEIGSMADLEPCTGMGSSSVFTVGLITGLSTLERHYLSPHEIAEQACKVEIDLVGKPIGKQDQYATTFGGINNLIINEAGEVSVYPQKIDKEIISEFENRLMMFYTGITRDANEILGEQSYSLAREEKIVISSMDRIKEIGFFIKKALMSGDVNEFGSLLDMHWQAKRNIGKKMSTDILDEVYAHARKNGALGGKIMGAGGGGLFLFCIKEGMRKSFKEEMVRSGLKYIDFRFEFEGVKVIANL
jgi:D-glycero-alpha-D-manno-heptose-7-phosphate kinase